MSSMPPFPPSGGYIAAVRSSCHTLRVSSGIEISHDGIARLLSSPYWTSSFPRLKEKHGVVLPLQFPSVLTELTVLSTLALLNFGSGYRRELHASALGRGAWDSVHLFVLASYITAEPGTLSAAAFRGATLAGVCSTLGLPMHVERAHPDIPGVVVGELVRPTESGAHAFAGLIADVLSETGGVLAQGGYPELGSLVVEALEEGGRVGGAQGVDADVVLEKLVRALPAFQDMAIVNGQPVYLFKKALFLLHVITQRVSSSSIPVPDTSALPVFSDNVLPSMLVHLGVLDLSRAHAPALRDAFAPLADPGALLNVPVGGAGSAPAEKAQGPTLSEGDAYTLRAAAVDACEAIVRASGGRVTLPEVDAWLWSAAKDRADYRALPRFELRDTVFF